jgi:uncharacterized protein YqeY
LEEKENKISDSELLKNMVPDLISDDELVGVIHSKIRLLGASGPKDMAKVMSEVMKDVKDKTDGKRVNSIVRDILSG